MYNLLTCPIGDTLTYILLIPAAQTGSILTTACHALCYLILFEHTMCLTYVEDATTPLTLLGWQALPKVQQHDESR